MRDHAIEALGKTFAERGPLTISVDGLPHRWTGRVLIAYDGRSVRIEAGPAPAVIINQIGRIFGGDGKQLAWAVIPQLAVGDMISFDFDEVSS